MTPEQKYDRRMARFYGQQAHCEIQYLLNGSAENGDYDECYLKLLYYTQRAASRAFAAHPELRETK